MILGITLSVRERYWQQYPPSCVSVWLLGPCYKTGEGTPLPFVNIEHHGEARPRRFLSCAPNYISAHFTITSFLHSLLPWREVHWRWCCKAGFDVKMEVLSLSLLRLQVLCHSLSKVLFKLSLTLLVRYRSSYSVFNFGRHIPADWHFTPKKCYSLSIVQWGARVFGSMGWHLLWLNTHMKGCVQQWVCFAHWISPIPHQSQNDVIVTTQGPISTRFDNEFGPSSLAAD